MCLIISIASPVRRCQKCASVELAYQISPFNLDLVKTQASNFSESHYTNLSLKCFSSWKENSSSKSFVKIHAAGLAIRNGDTTNNFLRDREATADLRPWTKSSRRGASTRVLIQAPLYFLASFFEKIDKNGLTSFDPHTVGCAPPKAIIRRSEVFLRCLSLATNYL